LHDVWQEEVDMRVDVTSAAVPENYGIVPARRSQDLKD